MLDTQDTIIFTGSTNFTVVSCRMSHQKRNTTKRFKCCFPFHAFSFFVQPIVKDDETHQERCLALINKKKNGRCFYNMFFGIFWEHPNQPAGVPKPTTTRRFLGDGEFGGTPRGH